MIGIFDSGLGGLTVLRELRKQLPQYDYLYLGDSGRAPYGNKSQELIFEYARQGADFLFKHGCELVIIACNTASAEALRRLQQEWLPKQYPEKRILGVVIPAAEFAAESFSRAGKRGARLGVIGTRATIVSRVYERELEKAFALVGIDVKTRPEVISRACPLLVPLIEEGWTGRPEARMILKKYLRPLKEKKITALILGCTHYPFLEKDIRRIMGRNVAVISTPKAVAVKLKDYLCRHKDIEANISRQGRISCFSTDEPEKFKAMAQKFLGENIGDVKRAELC